MRPELLVVGGANGVGKSTFAHEFLREHPQYQFLNTDEIARQLRSDNLYAAQIQAGKEFLRRLALLHEAQTNIVLESTLSGLSLTAHLRRFKQADTVSA